MACLVFLILSITALVSKLKVLWSWMLRNYNSGGVPGLPIQKALTLDMGEAQCIIKSLSFNSCLAPCLSMVFAALLLKGQHGFRRHLCKYLSLSGSFTHLVSLAGQWIWVGEITDSPVWLVTKPIFVLKMFLIFHWRLSSVCPCVSSPLGNIPLLLHMETSGRNLFPSQFQVLFWAHLRSAEQQLPVAFSAPHRTFCLVAPSLCCFQWSNSAHNSNLDHSPSSLSLAFCWFRWSAVCCPYFSMSLAFSASSVRAGAVVNDLGMLCDISQGSL